MRIINGRIITCEGPIIENGYVEFIDGKISGIGDMSTLRGDSEAFIDAEQGYVLPGFIDPHCHVGVGPESSGTIEYSETNDPIVPHYRAVDTFYPLDSAAQKAMRMGVTTVVTGPGSTTLIGGQMTAMKLNRGFADTAVVRESCAMKFALGSAPKSTFGSKGKAPVTRMAIATMIRETLNSAKLYMIEKEKGINVQYNMKYEALIPLLKRKIPAHIHCSRMDDIRIAIKLMEEFNIRCVLVHASQVVGMLDEVKEAGVSLILGPMYFTSRDWESEGMSFENPGKTMAYGIPTAICTDACPHLGSAQLLVTSAALSVRKGMKEEDAIRAITINAAKTCDIDNRVGSLKVGKDADILIFDEHPLDFTSKPKAVFIDGRRMI